MRGMLAVGVVLACGAAQAATMAVDGASERAPVPMSVRAVGQYQGQPVVLLEDANGTRRMPIWIGDLEATAIDLRIKKQKYPRPLTHDLLDSTLAALGAKIERVDIVDLARERVLRAADGARCQGGDACDRCAAVRLHCAGRRRRPAGHGGAARPRRRRHRPLKSV